MNALVLMNKGVMAFAEVPTPSPRAGHVLLKVKAVSICGSDIMRYTKGHRMYNLILGHECAGVIVQVGDGVSPALVGRRAAVIPVVPCFACEQCAAGRYSACHGYSFIGSRQAGGYAEYVELRESNALLLPDDMDLEAAALIEPSTVARHILDLGGFEPGQSAIVLGAGSVGLMAIQWLRILGASLIIATDVVDTNLAAARELGAHAAFNPTTADVKAEVKRLAGDGVDLAIEASGSPQALAQTIAVTRPRGQVVCGGNQPPEASLPMTFIEDLMRRELRLSGCFMSYSAPFPGHEWTDSVDVIQRQAAARGHDDLAPVPTVGGRAGVRRHRRETPGLPQDSPAAGVDDMSLVNPLPWLVHAQRERYAIGAFNANTLEQVQAIVQAAEAERAPALIQISHRAALHVGRGNATLGIRYMAAAGVVAAQSVSVPIGLHLDHANEHEVREAIALGFTSVMFDGGDLPFDENVARTNALCELAHSLNVCLEAELGEVPRADGGGTADQEAELTTAEDAVRFVGKTSIDSLAIALGSVHAIRQKTQTLDLDRLRAIRAAVDVPLVLHGSSGVTDDHIRAGIDLGLCKVNVATQLNQAFTAGVRAVLADAGEIDPRRYLGPAREAMVERVRERIRFFGASGKAQP